MDDDDDDDDDDECFGGWPGLAENITSRPFGPHPHCPFPPAYMAGGGGALWGHPHKLPASAALGSSPGRLTFLAAARAVSPTPPRAEPYTGSGGGKDSRAFIQGPGGLCHWAHRSHGRGKQVRHPACFPSLKGSWWDGVPRSAAARPAARAASDRVRLPASCACLKLSWWDGVPRHSSSAGPSAAGSTLI